MPALAPPFPFPFPFPLLPPPLAAAAGFFLGGALAGCGFCSGVSEVDLAASLLFLGG